MASSRPVFRFYIDWGNDGLFTAWTHEPNWQKAHNILLPNFSSKAMQGFLILCAWVQENQRGRLFIECSFIARVFS